MEKSYRQNSPVFVVNRFNLLKNHSIKIGGYLRNNESVTHAHSIRLFIARNRQFVPQNAYTELLRTNKALFQRNKRLLNEVKHLKSSLSQLKNRIAPHKPKQHIDYKKLNKSIDAFKELVDRS